MLLPLPCLTHASLPARRKTQMKAMYCIMFAPGCKWTVHNIFTTFSKRFVCCRDDKAELLSCHISALAQHDECFHAALSNPETSTARHPYTGNLNAETSGDSKDAFLHCGDVLRLDALAAKRASQSQMHNPRSSRMQAGLTRVALINR
jgi:hypothetical protein